MKLKKRLKFALSRKVMYGPIERAFIISFAWGLGADTLSGGVKFFFTFLAVDFIFGFLMSFVKHFVHETLVLNWSRGIVAMFDQHSK